METLLIILVSGLVCCLCFLCGAVVGQKTVKGESVTIPNPVKNIKGHIETKESIEEYNKEMERYNTILENIDKYDGTSRGQKEIPS